MEPQKILNLLSKAGDSKFVTRKWNTANDQSNGKRDAGNEINYNTEVLKSNICNYSDAYILVKGDITVIAVHESQVSFKNCTPFTECITKFDETTIDDVEGLDLVMPHYNLLE